MSDPSIKDFEAAIAELDGIVKKLEEGDLPLEQSLALYERGVQLSRFCHARLEDAERRIEILTERGELKPAPASLRPRRRRPIDRDRSVARLISGRRPHARRSRARGLASPAARTAPPSSARPCATASSPAASGCGRC